MVYSEYLFGFETAQPLFDVGEPHGENAVFDWKFFLPINSQRCLKTDFRAFKIARQDFRRAINASLSRRSFEEKKQGTKNIPGFSQGLFSELSIAQRDDWTPQDIIERGLEMLRFIETRCGRSPSVTTRRRQRCPGDILVSNFNSNQNLQGTGTTIVKISPSGQQSGRGRRRLRADLRGWPRRCASGVLRGSNRLSSNA
jgi:hypothetical protein